MPFSGPSSSGPRSASPAGTPAAPPSAHASASRPADAELAIAVSRFWSGPFLWFYLYFLVAVGLFAAFWQAVAPHPWWRWSILGSALLLFVTYFQVQVSVAINDWYGPFYDLIQAALGKTRPVTLGEFYGYARQLPADRARSPWRSTP